jgi:hypothetical protein
MKNEPKRQSAEPNGQRDTPTPKPVYQRLFLERVAVALAIFLLCSGVAPARDDGPDQDDNHRPTGLRRFIDQQVGGIDN